MKKLNKKGQATTELVLMLPFILAAIAVAAVVFYVCWQGLKTQQAANYAARINGQERVNGGRFVPEIENKNGFNFGSADEQFIKQFNSNTSRQTIQSQVSRNNLNGIPISVFAVAKASIMNMFTPSEQSKIFVARTNKGVISDEITVLRTFEMPETLFGIRIPSFGISAKAYGGEDSNMYGLPRWDGRWDEITQDGKDFYCGKGKYSGSNNPQVGQGRNNPECQ